MRIWDVDGITIGLYFIDDIWEVYYRKPGYAFRFAFGLLAEYTPTEQDAVEIAESNVHGYDNIFTEDGVDE